MLVPVAGVSAQGRISSNNYTCCHTETEVADPAGYAKQSRYIPTPGQPVPALTLCRQAPDRVATGVPIFKSMV